MKKTRNKIFLIIFSILSIVILYVFLYSLFESYKFQKETLNRAMQQIGNAERKVFTDNFIPDKSLDHNSQNRGKIYLGFDVYVIALEDGKYNEIVNYTENELDEEKIKAVANDIINNHKETCYIGNLFINRYAYCFSNTDSLILVDILSTNEMLLNKLKNTIISIILSEIFIAFVAYLLTKWIMNPIIKNFERQKQFIADASHELKTPISVMIASADMFYRDNNVKWVDNMKKESERMAILVKRLLDLSSLENSKNINLENKNLSMIIESSILTLESLFYEKQIKLKYKMVDNIYLKMDEERVKELISILLDNAIKHCDKNGTVNVLLNKNNKNEITLKVENTGLPIPKNEEEKIFERFYRSDISRNRNEDRYGLGLAIAKSIVESHKGQISAHSEKGKTTFKIVWNQKKF